MKKLLVVLLVLLAVFLGGALVISPTRHVERSVVIAAAPTTIHPYVDDLGAWRDWSAWDEADPDVAYSYEGPRSGVGAKVSWEGPKAGIGEQTIVESDPQRGVWFDMLFEKTYPAKVALTFEPVQGGTRVTFSDDVTMGLNPAARWISLFLDGMVGPAFERSLDNLKRLVEQREG